jgi:hypothetical protein
MTKVTRFFQRDDVDDVEIATGLSEAEAREHCRNPESSSRTATSEEARELTERCGPWFDGYEDEA